MLLTNSKQDLLYRTHRYVAKGIDPSRSKKSILDVCIHITKHIVNNKISVNFNQEYDNIPLAIISIISYLSFYFKFVHVKLMY
jgi:hypothetical protein